MMVLEQVLEQLDLQPVFIGRDAQQARTQRLEKLDGIGIGGALNNNPIARPQQRKRSWYSIPDGRRMGFRRTR